MRVIVTAVNPIEGLIDLDLVPEPGAVEAPDAVVARPGLAVAEMVEHRR